MREFAQAAMRLAGQAGVAFGWTPEMFWDATPAELAALARVLSGGDDVAPPDKRVIARMMEAFPDG